MTVSGTQLLRCKFFKLLMSCALPGKHWSVVPWRRYAVLPQHSNATAWQCLFFVCHASHMSHGRHVVLLFRFENFQSQATVCGNCSSIWKDRDCSKAGLVSVAFSKNTTWFATGLLALRAPIARFTSGPDGFLDKTESCLLSEIFYKKNQGQDSVRTWNLGFMLTSGNRATVLPGSTQGWCKMIWMHLTAKQQVLGSCHPRHTCVRRPSDMFGIKPKHHVWELRSREL